MQRNHIAARSGPWVGLAELVKRPPVDPVTLGSIPFLPNSAFEWHNLCYQTFARNCTEADGSWSTPHQQKENFTVPVQII